MPQLLFRNYHDGTATFVSGGTSKREIDGLYVDEYVRYLSDPYFSVRFLVHCRDRDWSARDPSKGQPRLSSSLSSKP